jgi:hypothetical protein
MPPHRFHTNGALRRLRSTLPSLLCAVALAISASAVRAESLAMPDREGAKKTPAAKRRFSLLETPAWLAVVSAWSSGEGKLRIDDMYGASGGKYATDLVAVFKLKLEEILEPGRLPIVTDFFRPYVIGGQGSIRVADDGQIGRAIPGSENCTALHIGGGGDFYLSRQFVFSLDFSQVLHSGSLSRTNYNELNAGLRFRY